MLLRQVSRAFATLALALMISAGPLGDVSSGHVAQHGPGLVQLLDPGGGSGGGGHK